MRWQNFSGHITLYQDFVHVQAFPEEEKVLEGLRLLKLNPSQASVIHEVFFDND